MLRNVGKVDYEIYISGRRKKKEICHVNMWYPPDDASEEGHRDIDAVDEDIPVWKELMCETTLTITSSCP